MVMGKLHSSSEASSRTPSRRRRGAVAPWRRVTCGVLVALVALVTLAVGGCGGSGGSGGSGSSGGSGGSDGSGGSGGSPDVGSVAGPGYEPNAVVARVGGHVVSEAAFAHALAGLEKFEVLGAAAPVPPDFTGCVQHLEKTSQKGSKPDTAALRTQCEQQYQGLLKQALDPLIYRQWVIGGAAELGLSVSEAELQAQLRRVDAGVSHAQILANLATRDETLAEYELETKVKLLAEKIRHVFLAGTEHVSQAQIAHYYEVNKSQFGVPPRRAMYIARTGTKAEALKVKREIMEGKSFASVVKRLPLVQPIYSKDGFVAEYEPNLYSEPPLNNAIFAAKPNVVSNPIRIFLGYYVFEVKRLIAGVPEPLAKAQATIRAELPRELYKQGLRTFIAGWRARWKARTVCKAGYVVAKCADGTPVPEDPYTLD